MTEIVFNARKINELYVSNDYEELSEYFLNVLASLQKQAWNEQNAERSRFVNLFLKSFLYFFTQEDYQLSDEAGTRFIRFNTLIGNLAGMSVFETTDSHLELLRKQSANFVKILTLLNARSQAKFETAQFFKAQPKFATLWYTEYFGQFYGGTPTKTMYDNARRHVSSLGLRWEYADPNMSNFYFFPSYFAIEQEARLKNLYHRLVKPIMARAKIKNSPNQKSIAIVSASWVRTSAVYKSLAPYVEALRHDYDLTLVRLGSAPNRDDFDDTWFKQVKNVAIVGDQFQLNEILENDFALAYFPDIGMRNEDRHLANVRIAPIQVMGYGHPVSTHGAEMDYFVGGQEVELLENARQNYSERLIAISGLGAFPVLPELSATAERYQNGERFIINCPWYAHKCTYPHLMNLRRIALMAKKQVLFRFFVGEGLAFYNQAVNFSRDVASVIGEDFVEIVQLKPYPEYQSMLNKGAFSLDSWPFGGYNTIVDSLAVGKPVVALEGNQAPNRLASAVLRRVELEDLVAKNPEEYVSIAVRLIDDDDYRESVIDRLARVDLRSALCKINETQTFKRAIDYLIENHCYLKDETSRDPILID